MQKYLDWRMQGGAPIVSIDELIADVQDTQCIVCTSGGYDPIHPGHISCMIEAKKSGSILVIIVNGDCFLTTKKGKPFQDLKTRCQIVSTIKEVDYVVPFDIENDMTVNVALAKLKPGVFAKGGDRIDPNTIPEWETCHRNNIKIITGIGDPKYWSSSQFLKSWVDFKLG